MKCESCKSCFKYLIVNNRRYLYCTLCRKAYDLTGDKLTEITDSYIVTELRKMTGNQI